jgi:glycosyltransferase involved in cell wall biosynthesis
MKIAYIARRPIPSVHAHAVQIVKMCDAFGRLGHEVMLFANLGDDKPTAIFDRYGVGRTFEVDVFPKRIKRFRRPRFAARLLRHPFIRNADLCFGRDITALAALSLTKKPIVYEAHTIPPVGSYRWRLLAWMFGRKNFSHLVCVTSTLADLHREQFPRLAGKPIIVAPNAAADVPPADIDLSWPGRPDAIQVGFAGRPFEGKGIELIIDAARQLPAIDFHVVGAKRDDLTWIEGVLPQNLHLHGYQPHGRLGSYFAKFDIAVAPYGAKVMNASRIESAAITSPLKLLEYMAAGLPSIVSDLPGVGDILEGTSDEVTLVVPPGDHRAFVEAIERLAADAALRQRIGKAARERYLEKHTSTARAQTVLGALAESSGQA